MTSGVGGAVEEDHHNLRSIEAETRSIHDADRLISERNSEIARQKGHHARERTNLAVSSYGINVGRLGGPGRLRAPSGGRMPRRIVSGADAMGAPVQFRAFPR